MILTERLTELNIITIQLDFAVIPKRLKRRMTTEATCEPPKRFAPLDSVRGNPHRAPPLKGIIFDVDGTLWYAFSVSPLCPLFLLPNQCKKNKEKVVLSITRALLCLQSRLWGLMYEIIVRIHKKELNRKKSAFALLYIFVFNSLPRFSNISSLPVPYYLKAHLHTAIMNSSSSLKNDFISPL